MTIETTSAVFDTSLFIPALRSRSRHSILKELVARAQKAGVVADAERLRETLSLREKVAPSLQGKGVAIPHARTLSVTDQRIVLARSTRGIAWSAEADEPVRLVVLVLSPAEAGEEAHVGLICRVATPLRQQRNRQRLLDADTFEAAAAFLSEALG